MRISEETIHYAVRFLGRYDIENKDHKQAVKELRTISDELIETLYQFANINVIRKPKPPKD